MASPVTGNVAASGNIVSWRFNKRQNVAPKPLVQDAKEAPVAAGNRPRRVPDTYDALVFSSGGSRGIAHLGAMTELERAVDLSRTRVYVGSSVGAIVAAATCLGMKARDVFDACVVPFQYQKNFRLHLLTKRFGLDQGESLDAFIASVIPEDVTFSSIYRDLGNVLSVIGTDLTTSSMAVFDPIRTPDMSVRDALRISCSVPFLFTAVKRDGHVYVDGALTAAFPVGVAIETYGCTRVMGLNFEEYVNTIHPETEWKFEHFLSTVVDTVVHANSRVYTHRGVVVDVCTIEMSPDVDGLAFDLTPRQKRDMFESGRTSMRVFLKKKR